MFQFLGRTVSRGWPIVLAAWIALLLGVRLAAPPWNSVAQDREFAFLPANSPSVRAEEVFRKAFPTEWAPSNIVLVLHRDGDDGADLKRDLKFINDTVEPALRQIAKQEGGLAYETLPSQEPLFSDDTAPAPPPKPRSILAAIHTPNAPGSGALLVSPDGKVLLVVMELTTEFLSTGNWPTITKVEELARGWSEQGKLPPGVSAYVTGSAVIGRDHTLAEYHSARATGTLTIILVILLLILIYRAPLLALIPLLTVYLGVQIALGILAILARAGYVTLFQGIEIYITILAYGAGVDYSLFLTARYKEVLDTGAAPHEAVAASVRDVGAALVASAATVMCGIGMMWFAEFGKFREAGLAIPLGIFLVLAATLTLSPALLRMAGRRAFWPQKLGAEHAAPGWLARVTNLHRLWDWVGERLVQRPATMWLTAVGVMLPFVIAAGLLRNQLSYDVIGSLPADSPSVVGTRVLQEHVAPGVLGPTTLLLVDSQVDFASPHGKVLLADLTRRLREQRQQLGLADVRSLAAPLGTPEGVQRNFALNLADPVRRQAVEEQAQAHYLTDLGGRQKMGTRIDLVMEQSPFSRRSIADLERVQQALHDALPADVRGAAEFYFVGPTASVRDLETVMQRDRVRIEVLVLLSVLLILVVLLRRVLLSLYLLATVLFSYFATLGVAFAVFWALDPHGFTGIDFKVAIFLFTILIAVGEDYNIFLMARVDEETRRHGAVRGITHALDRTGPVISSCGIIMAGTFASLLAGSLTEMKQLGFALAFGVLLDTFVVRPILVPAFLILVRTGRLSPSRWLRRKEAAPEREGEAAAAGWERRCADRRSAERRSAL